jgi:hypothetical protein
MWQPKVIRRYRVSFTKCSGVLFSGLVVFLQSSGVAFAAEPQHDSLDHPFSPDRIAKASQWKAPHAPDAGAMPGIKQGPFGDAWFESSVAALVRTPAGQAAISKIINIDRAGHYLVRFPGRPSSVVLVKDQQIAVAKLINKADWANILEMAVAKLYPQIKNETGAGVHEGQSGLTLLTGTPTTVVKLAEHDSDAKVTELLDVLDRCFHDSAPMITSTKGDKELTGKALPPNCTFAVVACDRKSKTIVLRSPFANDVMHQKTVTQKVDQTIGGITNLGGGYLKMPIKTWIDSFSDLSYSSLPST